MYMAAPYTGRESKMKSVVTILALVVLVVTSIAAHADLPQPQFSLGIRGVAGQEATTSSYMYAIVGAGDNTPFVYPANFDTFTVGYWQNGEGKLSSQTMAHPYASGDYQWEGALEVGANDARSLLTFDWWVDTLAAPNLSWYIQLHRRDTRQIVFRTVLDPGATGNWGVINSPISRPGYDLLVAAWDASPVPEPGSMVALATGLVGLAGVIRHRRK